MTRSPAKIPDPYQRYEETKHKQFKASCKLEDIELPDEPDPRELSAILDAYRDTGKR